MNEWSVVCGRLQCEPYHISDQVVMLGDAAHAMVPFFGQGLNCVRFPRTYCNHTCSLLARLLAVENQATHW